jgi:hypothetical protein
MTQMDGLHNEPNSTQAAREVKVTMRAVLFEVMIAMWIVAVLTALDAVLPTCTAIGVTSNAVANGNSRSRSIVAWQKASPLAQRSF